MKLEYLNKDKLCSCCGIGHLYQFNTILDGIIWICPYCNARFDEIKEKVKK
jgi:hypothetical protein